MIAVCGEALVDLVAAEGAAHYVAHAGGGPANTAVALARLGVPVAMVARLSCDPWGRLSRDRLAAAGVDLRWAVDAEQPHTLAVADLDERGAASYRFYLPGTDAFSWRADELPARLPAEVVAVHAGSLALLREPHVGELLAREAVRRTVVIDPNVRPALATGEDYRAALQGWLRLADVIKVSDDDLEVLAPGRSVEEAARSWLRHRPALVVVTRGGEGATAVWRDGTVHRPAPAVRVVDTVGAGDAFGAGLLAALHERGRLADLDGLDRADVEAALSHGVAAAAVTCSRPGADPAWRHELL